MASQKRSKVQREEDLQRTASLYLRGKTYSQISSIIGVTAAQIKYDMDEVRERWLASSIQDYDNIKALQVARIEEHYKAAWEGWEKSISKFESSTVRVKGNPDESNHVEKSVRKEDRYGDPRFLSIMNECVKQICDIYGIKESPKIDPDENLRCPRFNIESILENVEASRN